MNEENDFSHSTIQTNNDVEYNSYLDELIIHLVKERPALYDLRVPSAEKSRENKQSLWVQISKSMEGQLKPHEIEFRWKYLRENYLKARKKQMIKEEIARKTGVPLKLCKNKKIYAYRYYEIMQYLDDSLDAQKANQKKRRCKRVIQIKPSQKTQPVKRTRTIKEEIESESENDFLNETGTSIDDRFEMVDDGLIASPTNSVSEPETSFSRIPKAEPRNSQIPPRQVEKPTEIDNYLMRLGAGLKRLPYEVRCELEIEFLKRVFDEEKKIRANTSTNSSLHAN